MSRGVFKCEIYNTQYHEVFKYNEERRSIYIYSKTFLDMIKFNKVITIFLLKLNAQNKYTYL